MKNNTALEAIRDVCRLGIEMSQTEADHEQIDADLKEWRSTFEMLIAENTTALGAKKDVRRRSAVTP